MAEGTTPGAFVRKMIAAARTGTLDYEHRPPPKINWTRYDEAQVHELADTLELIRRLVDAAVERLEAAAPKKKRGRGRPPVPAGDIAKVLLLQAYLEMPNRVAQGFLELFGAKLGLTQGFTYKTIERGYDRRRVNQVLDEVLRLSNVPVRGLEHVFSVDGSGQPTRAKDNYERDRAHQSDRKRVAGLWPDGRHDYVYNVAVIGVTYKLIAGWNGTCDRRVGELSQFPAAFEQAKAHHPEMGILVGDGLYAGRPQVKLVSDAGVLPRFLPRRNVTLKRLGVGAWIEMLLSMARNPDAWFATHYLREASECGWSVYKNRHGPLHKRLDPRRRTEAYLRALAYNVRRLTQLRYLTDVAPLDAPFAC